MPGTIPTVYQDSGSRILLSVENGLSMQAYTEDTIGNILGDLLHNCSIL